MRSNARVHTAAVKMVLACGLAVTWLGCGPKRAAGPGYQPVLAPTTDRLVAAYADLASKRFQVLADFETPEQGTLFRREAGGLKAPLSISVERARRETGVGSLKLSLANSSQHIVASDALESQWALYRDWSKYHLLLRFKGGQVLTVSVQGWGAVRLFDKAGLRKWRDENRERYNELERKTIYTIVSKPIHRYQFLLGKLLGVKGTPAIGNRALSNSQLPQWAVAKMAPRSSLRASK